MVTGFSPCWQGYYISSMGGAGLVFDNLGINMLSLVGKAPVPSVLYLNRNHGEEIEVEVVPVDVEAIWKEGRPGSTPSRTGSTKCSATRYQNDPRILVTGPAAMHTDMGGIMSVPITKGKSATSTPGPAAAASAAPWSGTTASSRSSMAARWSTRTSATERWPTSGSRNKYDHASVQKD